MISRLHKYSRIPKLQSQLPAGRVHGLQSAHGVELAQRGLTVVLGELARDERGCAPHERLLEGGGEAVALVDGGLELLERRLEPVREHQILGVLALDSVRVGRVVSPKLDLRHLDQAGELASLLLKVLRARRVRLAHLAQLPDLRLELRDPLLVSRRQRLELLRTRPGRAPLGCQAVDARARLGVTRREEAQVDLEVVLTLLELVAQRREGVLGRIQPLDERELLLRDLPMLVPHSLELICELLCHAEHVVVLVLQARVLLVQAAHMRAALGELRLRLGRRGAQRVHCRHLLRRVLRLRVRRDGRLLRLVQLEGEAYALIAHVRELGTQLARFAVIVEAAAQPLHLVAQPINLGDVRLASLSRVLELRLEKHDALALNGAVGTVAEANLTGRRALELLPQREHLCLEGVLLALLALEQPTNVQHVVVVLLSSGAQTLDLEVGTRELGLCVDQLMFRLP
eukprot:jgi/Chrpa1/26406/Chrysochromulina_OHIO_Genome00008664-RA